MVTTQKGMNKGYWSKGCKGVMKYTCQSLTCLTVEMTTKAAQKDVYEYAAGDRSTERKIVAALHSGPLRPQSNWSV